MPNNTIRFTISGFLAVVLISCSSLSEQGAFENLIVPLRNRAAQSTRDGEDAKIELNTIIQKNKNKIITGWVCTQLSGEYEHTLPCQGITNIFAQYKLKITKDNSEKRFYQDTLTFSGEIEEIQSDSLGYGDIVIKNVTIDKANK